MGDLRKAFDQTVKSSGLIEPVDSALVEAGRKITDQIDFATDNLSGQELTKALYLTPHLMNILREMFATPKARLDAGIGKEDAGGKLAEVRQLRKRPAPTKKSSTA